MRFPPSLVDPHRYSEKHCLTMTGTEPLAAAAAVVVMWRAEGTWRREKALSAHVSDAQVGMRG